jgi:hypothetical protein
MNQSDIKKEIKRLNALLDDPKGKHPQGTDRHTAFRVTADGAERLSPRKAAMLAAKAEAKASGRIITVIVSTKSTTQH